MQTIEKSRGWCCLAVLAAACGCHSAQTSTIATTECICAPHGACAGYHPTCWRQWPDGCPVCPPSIEGKDIPPPGLPPAGTAMPVAPAETVLPPAPNEMPPPPMPSSEPPAELNGIQPGDDATSGGGRGAAPPAPAAMLGGAVPLGRPMPVVGAAAPAIRFGAQATQPKPVPPMSEVEFNLGSGGEQAMPPAPTGDGFLRGGPPAIVPFEPVTPPSAAPLGGATPRGKAGAATKVIFNSPEPWATAPQPGIANRPASHVTLRTARPSPGIVLMHMPSYPGSANGQTNQPAPESSRPMVLTYPEPLPGK